MEPDHVPEPSATEPLQPQVTPPAPTKDNGTQADAAELRKIEMERNMLRKKLEAVERERAEREQKELEEKEDYRALAERQKAELEAYRKEQADKEAQAAKEAATKEVFKDFDPKVVKVAEMTGISASDDSEESRAELKTRLEAIQKEMGITSVQTPRSTNPVVREPLADQEPGQIIPRPEGHLDIEDASKRLYLNARLTKPRLTNAANMVREQLGYKVREES